jgi:hypothetical protein
VRQQQAKLLLTRGERQALDPSKQCQGARHPALDGDRNLADLLGAVGLPEPIGAQNEPMTSKIEKYRWQ